MSVEKVRIRCGSITDTAIALASGATFDQTAEENGRIVFYVLAPPDLDLNDPGLLIPAAPLSSWVRTLSAQVRAFHKRKGAAR
jgi:hypothetical protein